MSEKKPLKSFFQENYISLTIIISRGLKRNFRNHFIPLFFFFCLNCSAILTRETLLSAHLAVRDVRTNDQSDSFPTCRHLPASNVWSLIYRSFRSKLILFQLNYFFRLLLMIIYWSDFFFTSKNQNRFFLPAPQHYKFLAPRKWGTKMHFFCAESLKKKKLVSVLDLRF